MMRMMPTTAHTYDININDVVSEQLNSIHQRRSSQNALDSCYYFKSPDFKAEDSDIDCQTSASSSPQSAAGNFSLSTFDTLPPAKTRSISKSAVAPASQSQLTGPDFTMIAEQWLGDPEQNNRRPLVHNRDTSLDSLDSLDPISPFLFNSSHPQFMVSDSNDYSGISLQHENVYQLPAKAPIAVSHASLYPNYSYSGTASVPGYADAQAPHKYTVDQLASGLLPPPDLSSTTAGSRHNSVASSVGSDSPATPSPPGSVEAEGRRRNTARPTIPKLDRTMTDVFGDELYHSDFLSDAPPTQSRLAVASPTTLSEVFAQRLQDANNQHKTTTAPISTILRGRSPFRTGSPLAPKPSLDFAPRASCSNMRSNTQQMIEWKKHEETTQALRQITQNACTAQVQTISPKDAILELSDEATNEVPLFGPQSSVFANNSHMNRAPVQADNFGALRLDSNFDSFLPTQLPASQLTDNEMQLARPYPFASKETQQPSLPSANSFSISSHLGSSTSSSSAASSPQRPEHVGAEGGTYTCTYHGCTQRFETPAILQKHKREGHRQAHGFSALRRAQVTIIGGTYLNTQAGPHKCERINPSTGKPCNTVFSRPYDLTRHEDTIHNGRKHKVRCDVCTEEKTFSRADALTRHYRVCHPDLEFPGKHRKRGGLSI